MKTLAYILLFIAYCIVSLYLLMVAIAFPLIYDNEWASGYWALVIYPLAIIIAITQRRLFTFFGNKLDFDPKHDEMDYSDIQL